MSDIHDTNDNETVIDPTAQPTGPDAPTPPTDGTASTPTPTDTPTGTPASRATRIAGRACTGILPALLAALLLIIVAAPVPGGDGRLLGTAAAGTTLIAWTAPSFGLAFWAPARYVPEATDTDRLVGRLMAAAALVLAIGVPAITWHAVTAAQKPWVLIPVLVILAATAAWLWTTWRTIHAEETTI